MSRGKRIAATLVVAALLAGALQYFGAPDHGDPFTPLPPTPDPRESRLVEGRVLLDGTPAAGAVVTLYEDADGGFESTVAADAEGAFALKWTPTAVLRSTSLYLHVEAQGRTTLQAARPGTTMAIEIPAARAVQGLVVDAAGRPVPDAHVGLALRHGRRHWETRADSAGSFVFEGLPDGARIALVAYANGMAPLTTFGFRCGQSVLLRLRPGLSAGLRVRDPDGRPVVGATAQVALAERALRAVMPTATSDAEGWLQLKAASPGGDSLLALEAPGCMSVLATASPHDETEVILWPKRTVTAMVYDAAVREGIDAVRFGFEVPHGAKWWGPAPGMVHREFKVRPGAGRGEFRIDLPRCRVGLTFSAPGFADGQAATVESDQDSVARGLAPLSRPPHGSLRLRAEGAPDGFPVAVAVGDEELSGLVELYAGTARLDVPLGKKLQIASPSAFEGFWLPLREIEPFADGEEREEWIALREATALEVVVDPPVEGQAQLVDVAHKRLARPARAELIDGRARFWVRPQRKVQIDVSTPANFFGHSGEFVPEEMGLKWEVRLRPAAGMIARIVDRAGNPVPFATAHVWEPGPGGRLQLRKPAREFQADHQGRLSALGLRGGEALIELRSLGLRSLRASRLRLIEGQELDLGTVPMDPPDTWSGRVVDTEGRPLSAVWVRVLEPGVNRLQLAGGAGIDVYDLQAHTTGPSISGEDGRFLVDEAAVRHPLLALYPSRTEGFAAMAVETDGRGADVVLRARAYLELDVPSSVEGVYRLVSRTKAVLIKTDPPVSLRPLPVIVPAGQVSLIIRLRDGRWAAPELNLEPGETLLLKPVWNAR